MKLSLSKTITVGPLKLTLSKTGLSCSIGVPGARIGANTQGKVNVALGIPGTGLQFKKSKKVL